MEKMITMIILLCIHASCAYDYPFQNPSLPWDTRVNDLVGRLTIEELIPQTMAFYDKTTPAIPRLKIKPYVWISECLRGQRDTNGTAFPQAIGLAATFSPLTLGLVASATASEVRAQWNAYYPHSIPRFGLSCFSPVINIARHPLWGRNQETYGEDPYLTSQLVISFVKELQGSHPRYVKANAGCKHFDVHGGPENIPVSRFSFDAKVSSRDWYSTFLPAFQACIKAGSYSLMCSYNSINGIPSCVNKLLLTQIARKEFGFKGYVVSDDGSIENIIKYHHYFNSSTMTAAMVQKAGCNLELGGHIFDMTHDAIDKKLLKESELRESVKPLFATRMRLGLFDPMSMNPYNYINMSVVQNSYHRKLAVEAAMKSFVLLKNENKTLPIITKIENLAIVGPMSDNLEQLYGDYSPYINRNIGRTPYESLKTLAESTIHASGCQSTSCKDYNSTEIELAVAKADTVIVCLGTGQAIEHEGHDRADLFLPGYQLNLLKDVISKGEKDKKIILLLFNAGPLDISFAKDNAAISAIMECFMPAQATGEALLKTFTADGSDSVPAARLPMTWPASIEQIPSITNYNVSDGQTYQYFKGIPLYPFGYGLSYTDFFYVDLLLDKDTYSVKDDIHLNVTVVNIGIYSADEVIQVYVKWIQSKCEFPNIKLVAFKRVHVEKQQFVKVALVIENKDLARWCESKQALQSLEGLLSISVGGQQPFQQTKAFSNILSKNVRII